MARYDCVLIDPDEGTLDHALKEGVDQANEKRRQRLVPWPLPGRDELSAELHEPTGFRQWNGGDGPPRSGEGRSVVALAWWTDRGGRKHFRIVGRHGPFNRPMLDNLFCPAGQPRPALWFVYPDHVFLNRHDGERTAQALCACGAYGEPEDLGWMGNCCDSCHDLGLEGQAAAPAWLDPRLATLLGEEGRLSFLAYSPDGKALAAGTARDEVTLWDTATGLERGRLAAPEGEWVLAVGWTADGQRLVTADVTGRLRYYNARTGLPTGIEVATGHADCFAVSAEGGVMARGTRHSVTLLSALDGQPLRELRGSLHGVGCLAFDAAGRRLTAGTRQGQVAVWDVATGQSQGEVDFPGALVTSVAFSPQGTTLAAGLLPAPGGEAAEACGVLLWDVAAREVKTVLPGHTGGTRCVAWAPDGRVLVSGGEDGLVRLWEVASGKERVGLEWHLDCVCSVAFAPDGQTLASGSFDGTIKLWPREVLRPVSRRRERGAVAP